MLENVRYIVSFSRRKDIINYAYHIDVVMLERCNLATDLGVLFDRELSFSEHIRSVTSSAYFLFC